MKEYFNIEKFAQRAPSYPFSEKEEYYRSLTPNQLQIALKDAKEAWKNQEAMEKKYPGHFSNKDAGWRADDVHTIMKIMKEKGM